MPYLDKAESKSEEFPVGEQNLPFGTSVDCGQFSFFNTTSRGIWKNNRPDIRALAVLYQ